MCLHHEALTLVQIGIWKASGCWVINTNYIFKVHLQIHTHYTYECNKWWNDRSTGSLLKLWDQCACMCVHIIHHTHIIPILLDDVGPCMLRQRLPITLLMHSAGSKHSSSLRVCINAQHSLMTWRDWVDTHRVWVLEDQYSQHSCQCHWCRTRRAGNTPPASVAAGWGSGGIEWTPWLSASGCGSGPSLSTAAGWWPTRCQRYWRTSGLEDGGGGGLKYAAPYNTFDRRCTVKPRQHVHI